MTARDYGRRLLLFILIAATASAHADPANCNLATSIGEQSEDLAALGQRSQCEADYRANKCEEFKAGLNDSQKENVLRCDQPSTLLGTVVSCPQGAGLFFMHAYEGLKALPGAIGAGLVDMGRWYHQCESDPQMRRDLLSPVAMLHTESEISSLVSQMHCDEIGVYVRNEVNATQSILQDKRRQQQYFANTRPGQTPPKHILFTAQEEIFERTQAAEMANLSEVIWHEIDSRMKCYSLEAKVRMSCEAITGVLTGVAIGATLKGLAAANAYEKAIDAGRGLLKSRGIRPSAAVSDTTATTTAETIAQSLDDLPIKVPAPDGPFAEYDKIGWKTKPFGDGNIIIDPKRAAYNPDDSYVRYAVLDSSPQFNEPHIVIDMVRGDRNRRGLGTYLIQRVIKDNPGKPIYGSLGWENGAGFKRAFLELQKAGTLSRENVIEALSRVPGFRAIPGKTKIHLEFENGELKEVGLIRYPDLSSDVSTITNLDEILADPRFRTWMNSLPTRPDSYFTGTPLF